MEAIMNLGAGMIVTAAFGQFWQTPIAWILQSTSSASSKAPWCSYSLCLDSGDEEVRITGNGQGNGCRRHDFIVAFPLPGWGQCWTCLKNWPLSVDLLLDTLTAYIAGEIQPEPQDLSQVTFSPNIKTWEEKLDWNKTTVNSSTKSVGWTMQ